MVTLLESSPAVTPCRDRGIASPLRTSCNSLVPCEEKSLLSRLLEWQRDMSPRRTPRAAGFLQEDTFTAHLLSPAQRSRYCLFCQLRRLLLLRG